MAKELKAKLKLTADAKGLTAEVTRADKSLKTLKKGSDKAAAATKAHARASTKTAAAVRKTGAAYSGAAANIGKLVAAGLGLHQLTRLARTTLANTIRQEQAQAQVEARIISTGRSATLTAKEVFGFASALQKVTTFGDEAILEGAAQLLSFTNISDELIPQILETGANLATGIKVDLRSAFTQLGKALGSYVGVTALGRSGVVFSESQAKELKKLFETNKLLEAQSIILGVVNENYGGAARAARETLGGALDALGNSWGDLLEIQTSATSGLRLDIEDWVTALDEVDVAELHGDVAAVAQVAGYLLVGALLRGAGALAVMSIAMVGTRVGSVQLASALLGATASTAVMTTKFYAGATAGLVLRKGLQAAAIGARVLRGALGFLTGPGGLILLAAYAAYEFATASGRIGSGAHAAAGDVDVLTARLIKMRSEGKLATIEIEKQTLLDDIDVTTKAVLDAQVKLDNITAGVRTVSFRGTTFEHKVDPAAGDILAATAELEARQGKLDNLNESLKTFNDTLGKPAPGVPASKEFIALQQSLRTATEKANDKLAEQRAIIVSDTTASEAARAELTRRAEAQNTLALADIAKKDADAAAKKEALDGVAALERITASNIKLGLVTDFSRVAIERRTEAARIATDVENNFSTASEATVVALKKQRAEEQEILRIQKIKADILAQFNPTAQVNVVERKSAITELADSGELGGADLNAAHSQLNIDAGEGGIADGYRVQLEQMLEDTQALAPEIGGEFAQIFGPGGTLQQGLADSAARSIVFGENFKDAIGGLARGAVAGLLSQIIQMGIQYVLINTLFKSQKATGIVAEIASVTSRAGATVAQAALSAYAATAAIPVVGPGLAPAAATKATTEAGVFANLAIGAAAAGSVAAFARGGVVDSPLYFSSTGIKKGVAGEAGPEAIIPLARKGGIMGVRNFGGGGQSSVTSNEITVAPSIVVNIDGTADGDGEEIGREVASQVAAMVRAVLMDEQRSGGLLNSTEQVA